MKQVAVVCGGSPGEYEVSLRSAKMVLESIDTELYQAYQVVITGKDWYMLKGRKKLPVDKNDFSVTENGKKLTFDVVYNIMHGSPGEDGKFQGYLDMLGIPYTSPGVLVSSLTMNKYLTKKLCKAHKIPVASSILVKADEQVIDVDHISRKLGLPCFVKPNNGGSSVATTKVYKKKDMVDAIELAFEHDDEVLIEEYIPGRELTCGVFHDGTDIIALPITEIVPHNDFFDYDAKYNGQSDEITPAPIDKKLAKKVQKLTTRVYDLFRIRGLVRVDFILDGDKPYFMEVNTIPGFSKASLIPQQISAAGMAHADVITQLIEQAIARKR